jgi:hypothetical protein
MDRVRYFILCAVCIERSSIHTATNKMSKEGNKFKQKA